MQFGRCDLASEVAHILHEHGVPPRSLQIEVTEPLLAEFSGLLQHGHPGHCNCPPGVREWVGTA